jgi:hypothetical protein
LTRFYSEDIVYEEEIFLRHCVWGGDLHGHTYLGPYQFGDFIPFLVPLKRHICKIKLAVSVYACYLTYFQWDIWILKSLYTLTNFSRERLKRITFLSTKLKIVKGSNNEIIKYLILTQKVNILRLYCPLKGSVSVNIQGHIFVIR